MKALLLSLFFVSSFSFGSGGFLPDNNLWIPTDAKRVSNVTEEEFNKVITLITEVYSPIVAEQGKVLKIEGAWNDGTVNAYASQPGNQMKVNLFGGLARHEAMTLDGFIIVVCHELGHHLGGTPKKFPGLWASAEGQSDYYSTNVCLKTLYAEFVNLHPKTENEFAVSKCSEVYSDPSLCVRSAMAALAVGNIFHAFDREVKPLSLETPDLNVVTRTNASGYPGTQCRVDTYFQGALCDNMNIQCRPKCWFAN